MRSTLSKLAPAGILLAAALASPTAEARFAYAYNYPDLAWHTIETEHFAVHYPVSRRAKDEGNEHYLTTEWSARQVAEVSEEMFNPMCAEFNYYLKEKVHIVMLNHPDDLEGFTVPNWDWIEISANPGGSFYRMRGRMEWFSDVMVHEFAHVVSLKANAAYSEGTMGVVTEALYRDGINNVDTGVSLFLMDGDSVFWTEGGAEYWSDEAGYNWWTPSRDQFIRSTVLEGRLLEYDEWHTRSGKGGRGHWADGERYYQQGYSFGQYLRQRFGPDTYARFGLKYGEGWRSAWETVIEDVVGVDAETLYNDWRAYVTERYGKQAAQIRARGEVLGREVLGGPADWEYLDPEARDAWEGRRKHNNEIWKEIERERTGTYQFEPRISPDGRYMGATNYGMLNITQISDDQMFEWTGQPAINPGRNFDMGRYSTALPASFDHGWDYFPRPGAKVGEDLSIVITGNEDEHPRSLAYDITGIRFEGNGYNWNQLYIYDFPLREEKEGKHKYMTRERKKVGKHERFAKGSWKAIPNTLRGSDPSVSPDGKKIAYFEYTDGTMNLVTINPDGTEKKHLTQFKDGTWMQTVDWSPDGSQLVFAIFRNFQQQLYTINADGSNLKAITWDNWEKLDAHWSSYDGRIYFSADPDGVFNIYAFDPKSEKIEQLTNVVNGAFTPQISPEGNLLFMYLTSYGQKVYGLPRDQFFNQPADHYFRMGSQEVDQKEVQAALSYSEDLSKYGRDCKDREDINCTHNYRPGRSVLAPWGVPIFSVQNDSRTNWGLQAGGQVLINDYVEKHNGFAYFMLGEDPLLAASYTWQSWYPNFSIFAYHALYKYDAAYMIDLDDDDTTSDDQEIYEVKNQQYVTVINGNVQYPWNDVFSTSLYAGGLEYGFKGIDDDGFQKYMQALETGLMATYSSNAFLDGAANPYFGRTVDLTLAHAWTDIVYKPYGGIAPDDGQLLDLYSYNKAELTWAQILQVPTFGVPFLQEARNRRHVFELNTRLGWVDRNVSGNDEFRAGGRHPSYAGRGSIRPNTQFAGYPAFSLSGETMGILGLAYRFPIDQFKYWKTGPLWTNGIFAQFGGTAGNLWSFRPPEDPALYYRSIYGERIARNPEDVTREIPFVDEAYKNGNRMLYDVSAELRVQSTMFHGAQWNSFLRLAYGFQEIRGYGDVNGDDIYDTSESALGDELSNETEKPGLRAYIGLGTGW